MPIALSFVLITAASSAESDFPDTDTGSSLTGLLVGVGTIVVITIVTSIVSLVCYWKCV